MRTGYPIGVFESDYPFIPITDNCPEIDIKENLKTFKRLIEDLPANVGILSFAMESPFNCNFPIEKSPLGIFQEDLFDISKLIKQRDLRLSVFFDKLECGLANKDFKIIQKVKRSILNYAEVFDLLRLDYSNLFFIPYGDEYVCDFQVFQRNLFDLPKYAVNRIAIKDSDNFKSMIIADHRKMPWVYDFNTNEKYSDLVFGNCKQSFFNFRLKPQTNPLLLGEPNAGLIDISSFDVVLTDATVSPIKKKKKFKIRLKDATSKPTVSRQVKKKTRRKKKTGT